MNARPVFRIDLSERFLHLARAPIVEAVIHWRARSEEKLKHDELRRQLDGQEIRVNARRLKRQAAACSGSSENSAGVTHAVAGPGRRMLSQLVRAGAC